MTSDVNPSVIHSTSELARLLELDDAALTDGDLGSVFALRSPQGEVIAFPSRELYHPLAVALYESGFELLSDLCAVDYLLHPERRLPVGVEAQRFEVSVALTSISRRKRVRLRVQVPAEDPVIPTLWDVYPGAEAMEREAYDLFGVVFEGHPDLTRILMPEDWEGHPLRKDYPVGRVPVQFKEAPGPR